MSQLVGRGVGFGFVYVMLFFCCSSPAIGQGLVVQAPQEPLINDGGDEQIKSEIDKMKKKWQVEMKLLIADLDETCKLDDKQRVKLEVAAKGSVEKLASSVEKRYAEMAANMGLPLQVMPMVALAPAMPAIRVELQGGSEEGETVTETELAEASQEREPEARESEARESEAREVEDGWFSPLGGIAEEVVDAEELEVGNAAEPVFMDVQVGNFNAAQMGMVFQVMEANGMASSSSSPADQEFWQKTVAGVLTEQQNKLWETAIASREQRRETAKVRSFLVDADSKLRFSDKQMEKVTAIVGKTFGKFLAAENDQMRRMRVQFAIGMQGNQEDRHPEFTKAMRAELSEGQFSIWRLDFQPKLDFMESNWQMQQQFQQQNDGQGPIGVDLQR